MKRTFATAFAAVALTAAAPAYAVDMDFILSDILPGGPFESEFGITSETPTTVSAELGRSVGLGSFVDRYIFAPTFFGTGSGFAGANNIANLVFGTPGLRIDGYSFATAAAAGFVNIGADLFAANTTTNLGVYNTALAAVIAYLDQAIAPTADYSQVGQPFSIGGTTGRALDTVPLDTNLFYVITIDGTGGSATSIYSGDLSTTAVPEPATWAMMLAGFGLIGFAMRRQRQSHPKVRFAF